MQVVGDQLLRLGLHPGGDEGREVALRFAVEVQLGLDEQPRGLRGHAGIVQTVGRKLLGLELREDRLARVVERHVRSLLGRLRLHATACAGL